MAPHMLRLARLQEGRVLQRRTGACVTCPVVIPRAVMQLLLVTNTAILFFVVFAPASCLALRRFHSVIQYV
jgi:hypothetical protein